MASHFFADPQIRIFRAGRVCPFQEILGSCWNGRKNQNSEVWGGLRILGEDPRGGRSLLHCRPRCDYSRDSPWQVLLLQLLCLPDPGEAPSQPPLHGEQRQEAALHRAGGQEDTCGPRPPPPRRQAHQDSTEAQRTRDGDEGWGKELQGHSGRRTGTCGPQRGLMRAGVMEAAAKPRSRLEEQGCQGLWSLCLSGAETRLG